MTWLIILGHPVSIIFILYPIISTIIHFFPQFGKNRHMQACFLFQRSTPVIDSLLNTFFWAYFMMQYRLIKNHAFNLALVQCPLPPLIIDPIGPKRCFSTAALTGWTERANTHYWCWNWSQFYFSLCSFPIFNSARCKRLKTEMTETL